MSCTVNSTPSIASTVVTTDPLSRDTTNVASTLRSVGASVGPKVGRVVVRLTVCPAISATKPKLASTGLLSGPVRYTSTASPTASDPSAATVSWFGLPAGKPVTAVASAAASRSYAVPEPKISTR